MIKLKKLLQEKKYAWDRKFGEPLPTLRLEQDEPDHFGGGENIKIFDYQTEHFDICRSAVILYQRVRPRPNRPWYRDCEYSVLSVRSYRWYG